MSQVELNGSILYEVAFNFHLYGHTGANRGVGNHLGDSRTIS